MDLNVAVGSLHWYRLCGIPWRNSLDIGLEFLAPAARFGSGALDQSRCIIPPTFHPLRYGFGNHHWLPLRPWTLFSPHHTDFLPTGLSTCAQTKANDVATARLRRAATVINAALGERYHTGRSQTRLFLCCFYHFSGVKRACIPIFLPFHSPIMGHDLIKGGGSVTSVPLTHPSAL